MGCWKWELAWFVLAAASCSEPPSPVGVPRRIEKPPVDDGLEEEAALAVADTHACLVTARGELWCWGDNAHGQLGPNRESGGPYRMETDERVAVVTVADAVTCTCSVLGVVRCWGLVGGFAGQMEGFPGRRLDVPPCRSVALGGSRGCSVSRSGDVYCWGAPLTGRSFEEPSRNTDVAFVTLLDLGRMHGCAADKRGWLTCWGGNLRHGLSDGSRVGGAVRVSLEFPLAVAAGFDHSCALMDDGVACWGTDLLRSQHDAGCQYEPFPLMLHHMTSHIAMCVRGTPEVVRGTEDAVGIAAGHWRSCALLPNADLACWGVWNDDDGSPAHKPPFVIGGDVIAFDLADDSGCMLTASGEVRCWGWVIGEDGRAARLSPVLFRVRGSSVVP